MPAADPSGIDPRKLGSVIVEQRKPDAAGKIDRCPRKPSPVEAAEALMAHKIRDDLSVLLVSVQKMQHEERLRIEPPNGAAVARHEGDPRSELGTPLKNRRAGSGLRIEHDRTAEKDRMALGDREIVDHQRPR